MCTMVVLLPWGLGIRTGDGGLRSTCCRLQGSGGPGRRGEGFMKWMQRVRTDPARIKVSFGGKSERLSLGRTPLPPKHEFYFVLFPVRPYFGVKPCVPWSAVSDPSSLIPFESRHDYKYAVCQQH